MPRPKRTKVAPSGPAPRVRKPTRPAAVAKAPEPQKDQFDDLYDVSDQEYGVATDSLPTTSYKGKEMAVVVPKRPARGTVRDSEAHERDDAQDMEASGHAALEARFEESPIDDIDLDSSSPVVEIGRRERGTPLTDHSVLAIGKFKRRARQPSILGRATTRARSSSVESNLAEDNGLTSVGGKNTSVVGSRRPRGNSFMAGTPAHVGSALKIGNFRRRARQPSILGTAQKPLPQRPEFDDDGEEEFNPDDESTPLTLFKTKEITFSSSVSSRKRKLSVIQVPRSPSSSSLPSPKPYHEAHDTVPSTNLVSDEEGIEEAAVRVVDDENNVEEDLPELSSELSPGPMPPPVDPPGTPEPFSDTMAPPRSSSVTPSSPELHPMVASSRGRRPLRGRNPPPTSQESPISSPPSLTHSPNRIGFVSIVRPARKAPPPPSTFSTAQLQALLPRRRRRAARDVYDMDSSELDVSGLASDDDELSHLNARPRTRRPAATLSRTPAPPARKAPKSTKTVPKPKGPKRTYGSRVNPASDKENEAEVNPDDSLAPLPDQEGNVSSENSQELEHRVGKELKRAARKFEEVDKWELDFEEITASSSSPRSAR